MRALPVLLLLLALSPACGGDPGPAGAAADADPLAPDADPLAPDAVPGAPDAAPPGTPDAAPPVPSCQKTCAGVGDCVIPQSPLYDADNYACTQSRCRWLGCHATSECASLGAAYACASADALPTCLHTCVTASDCDLGNALNDADNYACQGGFCRYQGCNGDGECTATLGAGYGCRALAGTGLKSCVKTCGAPSDCVLQSTLYDLDNWACVAGGCQWLGCHATSECTGAFMNNAYVCE